MKTFRLTVKQYSNTTRVDFRLTRRVRGDEKPQTIFQGSDSCLSRILMLASRKIVEEGE